MVKRALVRSLSLLAVAVVAVGIAYWQATREPEAVAVEPLLSFSAAALVRIELDGPAGSFLLVRSAMEPWSLERPVRAAADARAVEGLLTTLAELEVKAQLPPGDDLARFGLSPPVHSLVLTTAAGRRHELVAGEVNRFDGSVYVRRGAVGPVLTTDGNLRYQLARELSQWRDKRLLMFDPTRVAALEVTFDGERRYGWQRRGDALWLDESASASASTSAAVEVDPLIAKEIIEALRGLRAQRFLSESATASERQRLGLERPDAEIILRLIDAPEPRWLQFSRQASGELFANAGIGKPIAQLAGASILDRLDRRGADLRDRRVLHFDRDRVARVVVRHPDASFTLDKQRREGRWGWSLTPVAGGPVEAKASEVFALLYKLWTLRAEVPGADSPAPVRLATRGLGPQAATIELLDAEGGLIDGLRLGNLIERSQWVSSLASGRAGRVAISDVDRITLAETHYRETQPSR